MSNKTVRMVIYALMISALLIFMIVKHNRQRAVPHHSQSSAPATAIQADTMLLALSPTTLAARSV